jgi:hypothetical protein
VISLVSSLCFFTRANLYRYATDCSDGDIRPTMVNMCCKFGSPEKALLFKVGTVLHKSLGIDPGSPARRTKTNVMTR